MLRVCRLWLDRIVPSLSLNLRSMGNCSWFRVKKLSCYLLFIQRESAGTYHAALCQDFLSPRYATLRFTELDSRPCAILYFLYKKETSILVFWLRETKISKDRVHGRASTVDGGCSIATDRRSNSNNSLSCWEKRCTRYRERFAWSTRTRMGTRYNRLYQTSQVLSQVIEDQTDMYVLSLCHLYRIRYSNFS